MKRYIFLILFLQIQPATGQDQRSTFDVRRMDEGYRKPDTAFVNYLTRIGIQYTNVENDSAQHFFNEAIKFAGELSYISGELKARERLAWHLLIKGEFAEALRLNIEVASQARGNHDHTILFMAIRQIAWIYREIGDLTSAREYLDQMHQMISEGRISTPFAHMTTAYYEGLYHMSDNDFDSAQHFMRQTYRAARKGDDVRFVGMGAYGLGESFRKGGLVDSAMYYYRISESVAPIFQRNDVYRSSIAGIADLLLQQRKLDSARYYAARAFKLSTLSADIQSQQRSSAVISRIFASQKAYDSAFYYERLNRVLSDSLHGQAMVNRIKTIAVSDQIANLQEEQERKNAELTYKANVRTYSLMAGMLGLLGVIGVLIGISRQRKRSKEKIEKAYKELRATQSQLIQSEKMASLGELTAGIAHEIENPLNFVNNFSEVSNELMEELKTELSSGNKEQATDLANDIKQNLEKINHHGKRADAIVKSMLQHSRASSGKKEPTDINALCDEYVRLAYHGFRAKDKSFQAKFDTQLDPSLPKASVVAQDISRIILNLINNAFYAVNEKSKAKDPSYEPRVTISTKNYGNKIEISVQDNGAGIPDQIKEKIFQPFFTTKPTGQGTGLGLSLSYDIVKAHGGTLEVDTHPGKTVFNVVLPLEK